MNIPDKVEKELMHQILDNRYTCVKDRESDIRDAIRVAYEEGWEEGEENAKKTVGYWYVPCAPEY